MEYKVIRKFKDRLDNNRIYEVNEKYEGSKAPKRISKLINPEKNDYGKIYLEKVDEVNE